jgi:hypothetical protein
MAGGHGSPDLGRHSGRPDHVRPHWRHAGIEPKSRTNVYWTEAAQLGAPEAEAGPQMDIYDGVDWTEMDIEDLRAELEHGHSIEEAAQFLCRADSLRT